ncbi:hypothetical protein OF83DRAFT_871355 [Amylostereum chailletii]|nr:hypothetical protein OF83DRAFT_871355 [Amylostereum chailletii]
MTVTHRKRQHQPEEISTINEPGYQIDCDGCLCNLTHSIRIKCADPVCQPDDGVDLCPSCFCSGKEFREHKRHHAYRVVELHSYPIFSEDWGADEELLLIEGISLQGLGNWEAIAEHIGTRTKEEVEEHYKNVYIDSPSWPLPLTNRHFDIDPSDFQERKRRRISNMPTAPPPVKVAPTSAPGTHEVATFLPGRLEFEHELDNEAEDLVKDLEFGYCYEWGGDQIKEDELDPDIKKRAKWAEEKQKAKDDSFLPPLPVMMNGNTNGMHSLNGACGVNGIIKKEKEGPTRSEEPGTEDGEDDSNEENMPPIPFETAESLTFKLSLHEMYAQRVEKREESKQLMLNRGLLDYKKMQAADKKRPKEEREIIHRLRPFAKLQTAEDYEVFCADILYEAMLRKRIAELQQYRRLGLLNEADIKKWEEDTYKRSQAKANMSRDYISSERIQQLRAGSGRSSLGPEGRRDADSRKSHDPDMAKAGGTGPPGRRAPAPLNLANSPSLHLLTPAEQTLCSTLRILPKPYLAIKETLVREYARRGGKLRRREARDLVKIDVNKTSRVWDFLVQAGYLRFGDNTQAQTEKSQQQSEPPENSAAGPSGTPATESQTPSPAKSVAALAQPPPPPPASIVMPPPLSGPSILPSSSSFTFSVPPFPPPVWQSQ